jgi:hypothetical protein
VIADHGIANSRTLPAPEAYAPKPDAPKFQPFAPFAVW